MTAKRFPGVVPDGATAAGGGKQQDAPREPPKAPPGLPPAAAPRPHHPRPARDYEPFVGPICSKDGKAAIVTAYIKGNGEGERILDPVKFWRDEISNPGGGLEVKITGGAGFSADAIEVFEGINGTLLLAAVSLVIFLLIVIYRSPMFFFIPLVAVLFAEILSRSIGYGVSELGVTVNGQSSSIMSVLVLGAGTDYALLLVARYREELHHTADKYQAMARRWNRPGRRSSPRPLTVIAALLCLMIAKVNGTSGLGPIAAIGVACAALSMLTLLPALLTIFGRRAFWPFVPHTPETAPRGECPTGRARRIVDGSGAGALARVVLVACWPVLLPAGAAQLAPALHQPPPHPLADLRPARPRRLHPLRDAPLPARAHRRRHPRRLGPGRHRVAISPRRVMFGSVGVLLILCAGFAFFSTDLTSEDSYRTEVESVEGQHLLDKSFPSGTTALTDVVVPEPSEVDAVRKRSQGSNGVEAVSGPVASGPPGTLVQATLEPNPYSTEAFDLIEPIRDAAHGASPGALVGGPTAIEFDVRDAAGWDSIVIPPIILLVVFLILIGLLRAVMAPLVLIGTVILSFLAALGVGYFVFDVIFGFPGSDPSLPLFAFVFLVALGVDYNIFLVARAREETEKHGSEQGILRALAVTGGVITSAGIVLAGTFSVLAVLPLTFLTELGFVVAFGVLLDTFLVRSVLVPAIALTLGDKFWWPSTLSRSSEGTSDSAPTPPTERAAR